MKLKHDKTAFNICLQLQPASLHRGGDSGGEAGYDSWQERHYRHAV